MSWDRLFWLLFAISELILIVLLYFDFSLKYLLASVLIFILAVSKLAEDDQKLKAIKKGVTVRKDILNKLKRNK
jgi:hypothetical protein